MNPDLVICHLDDGATLNMEITADTGKGYVPAVANRPADAPIGLICRTGNRTTHMQKVLQDAGFTQVINIKEGMVGSAAGPGWLARGLPVEACKTC
jgi:DNA-directed RNA polymerase alpha subunit